MSLRKMGWSRWKDVDPPHPPPPHPDRNGLLFACMRVECSRAGHNADDSGVDGRPKDCDITSPKTLNIHVTLPSQRSRPKSQ